MLYYGVLKAWSLWEPPFHSAEIAVVYQYRSDIRVARNEVDLRKASETTEEQLTEMKMMKKRSIAAHQGGMLDERTAADAPFGMVYGTMADASSATAGERAHVTACGATDGAERVSEGGLA